ncbi:hypothetical protein E2562_013954 [Oryza meyeriana var. granulata]|uniref:Uncharacterized protein n=1 Tax=Oryza meyeriana var. granulata TaxID=110450 RepID=A0A6G1DIR1_9ORYZ|nr:hypothetical protein E2562_013954 [Oryza meyeriana var. granulata]
MGPSVVGRALAGPPSKRRHLSTDSGITARARRRSCAAEMAVADVAFKALTAGLGVATLYLAATFSVNVYRGLSWHSEQSKLEKEKRED